MSEVKDLVLPILRELQVDIGSVKTTLADHSAKLNELNEKFDGLSGYVTCQMA